MARALQAQSLLQAGENHRSMSCLETMDQKVVRKDDKLPECRTLRHNKCLSEDHPGQRSKSRVPRNRQTSFFSVTNVFGSSAERLHHLPLAFQNDKNAQHLHWNVPNSYLNI